MTVNVEVLSHSVFQPSSVATIKVYGNDATIEQCIEKIVNFVSENNFSQLNCNFHPSINWEKKEEKNIKNILIDSFKKINKSTCLLIDELVGGGNFNYMTKLMISIGKDKKSTEAQCNLDNNNKVIEVDEISLFANKKNLDSLNLSEEIIGSTKKVIIKKDDCFKKIACVDSILNDIGKWFKDININKAVYYFETDAAYYPQCEFNDIFKKVYGKNLEIKFNDGQQANHNANASFSKNENFCYIRSITIQRNTLKENFAIALQEMKKKKSVI